MKRKAFTLVLLPIFWATLTTNGQNFVALHSATGVTHHGGTLGFKNAYTAANAGDTIYLPGGQFIAPDSLAKTVYVIGVGHYPNFTQATQRTYVTGELKINPGAQNSYFEGIHFAHAVTFKSGQSINNVMFRRCRIDGAISFAGNRTNPSLNTQFIQCVIAGVDFWLNGNNSLDMVMSNCIVSFYGFSNLNSALIANNVFIRTQGWLVNNGSNSIYRNNIIRNDFFWSGSGNLITKNVFFVNQGAPGNNNFFENFLSVALTDFFESYNSSIQFSYDFDFHLKNPQNFVGTDGNQVGIYGGLYPFKDGSVPFTPHVISKSISTSIDANGKVQVQIQVAAQDE